VARTADAAEIVVRPLSATQAATRRRLIEAAIELADEGGYDAVTVRSVAARAGLSAPTAYQYFGSKDHLLVDALVDLVSQTTVALDAAPSPGPTPAERAATSLRRAVKRVEDHPELYTAMTRAYISGTASVAHARAAMEASMRRWIEVAVGDDADPDVQEVLEDVLFANMVGLVTGRRDPAEIGDALDRAAHAVLDR
jgi:AcrR family transcriptional regulator